MQTYKNKNNASKEYIYMQFCSEICKTQFNKAPMDQAVSPQVKVSKGW